MKEQFLAYACILAISIIGCHNLEYPLDVIDSKDIIILEVVDANLHTSDSLLTMTADSLSSRLIRARLNNKSDGALSITFTTTAGVLTKPGELPSSSSSRTLTIIPADREVLVQLNALDIANEQVIVSGTVGTTSNTVQITFTQSYPEKFNILPSALVIDKDDTATISINALRANGYVSENILYKIKSSAPDSLSISIPSFGKLNNQMSQFQVVNVTGKTGKLNIEILIPSSAKDTLSNLLSITYE